MSKYTLINGSPGSPQLAESARQTTTVLAVYHYCKAKLTAHLRPNLLLLIMLFPVQYVLGQLLVSQDFTAGAAGGAVTAVPISWGVSGAGNSSFVLNSAEPLNYPAYTGGGGNYLSVARSTSGSSNVGQTFTASSGTNTFYYSFLLKANTVGTDYFAALSSTISSGSYFARLYMRAAPGGYNLGITKAAATGTFKAVAPTLLTIGATYLVMVKYVVSSGSANDQVFLWINPSLASEPLFENAEVTVSTGTDASALNQNGVFTLRGTTSGPSYHIDGIRVAVGATSVLAYENLAPAVLVPVITSFGYSDAQCQSGNDLVKLPVSGGGTVTITGKNFMPGMAISTGEQITVLSATSAIYTLGQGGFGALVTPQVTTSGGTSVISASITYISNNANLSDLALDRGSLSPFFDTAITTYYAQVSNETAVIAVTPTLAFTRAIVSVEINGSGAVVGDNGRPSENLPLKVGENIIRLSVSAEDGTIRVYTIYLTREKAAQVIALPTAATKTFGDPDFAAATASSGLQVSYMSDNNAVIKIINGSMHIVGAGTATIVASQGGDETYFAAPDASMRVTVNKAVANLTLANLTTMYDGSPKVVEVLASQPDLNGITITYDQSVSPPTNAGTYVVVATMSSANYTAASVTGNLVIEKAPATIRLADLLFTYDGLAKSATVITAPAGLSGVSISYDGKDIAPISAGAYNVIASLSNPNYKAADTTGVLAIDKASVTITIAEKTKIYGDADPLLTYNLAGGVLASGDEFTGTISRDAGQAAGIYQISQGTLTLGNNYSLTVIPANFIVRPAPLLIKAEDKDRFQGKINPLFTFSYTGFVNGESNSVLTAPPNAFTLADLTSPVGEYAIIPIGATAVNYKITYENGKLKVHPGAPSDIIMRSAIVYENQVPGTAVGTLSGVSADPGATFSYALVPGIGAGDNQLFTVIGNEVFTAVPLDHETKAIYSILVRCTAQTGLFLDKQFQIIVNDVNEAPTLDVVPDQSLCYVPDLQTVRLNGITAGPESGQSTRITVSSNLPALFKHLEVANSTISYILNDLTKDVTAIITVTVTDNGGTANNGIDRTNRSFELKVNSLPVIDIVSDVGTEMSKGHIAKLNVIDLNIYAAGNTYVWNPAPGTLAGWGTVSLTVRPETTTTYTVVVTNASGCSVQKSILMTVAEDYRAVNPSNVMSPNGDGINDRWVIKNIDMYPNNEVKVFDRAGRLVFNKKGYQNDWDGTTNEKVLVRGTYFYIIDFGDGKGLFKGFITMVMDD